MFKMLSLYKPVRQLHCSWCHIPNKSLLFFILKQCKNVDTTKNSTRSFYSLSRICHFFVMNHSKNAETKETDDSLHAHHFSVSSLQERDSTTSEVSKICVQCKPGLNTMPSLNIRKKNCSSHEEIHVPFDHSQITLSVVTNNNNGCPMRNVTRNFSTTSGCSECKENITLQNSSTPVSKKLYMAPKNVLHNAFDIVVRELNNKDFKIQPVYSTIEGNNRSKCWCCTYHIKWPEVMKFKSVAQTKKEASHKAAVDALLWLQSKEKITNNGFPVIIGKKAPRDTIGQEKPKLLLDNTTLDQMKTIVDIYHKDFEPLKACQLQNNQTINQPTDENQNNLNVKNIKKRLFDPSRYFVKEKTILPISEYKDKFINLLQDNRIVIVKGEPGCGKSTRIPQYVLEAWTRNNPSNLQEPCQIAVTQPRRIAAISLAKRVSDERDEHCGHIVGYQVRLNSNFNTQTGRIFYCTTGILLNYLQNDISLRNFTHVILDEVHERDVNTDLLMNLLRRSMELNHLLKIIIMSATIDTDFFKDYFDGAPVLPIPGFTFPVKSYFIDDLTNLSLNKTCKISSDDKINPYVVHEDVVKVITHIHKTKKEGGILCFLPGWEDITRVEKLLPVFSDMTVLCLHSRLQDRDQRKIFQKTPPGVRKVILCTNIAETSVTIDDVVYVVDTGIHKESRFDYEKAVTCIDNYWISKSSMKQRKGRAGRVQPGECFHLYTKSKYESFPLFTDPGILKTALTKIVLDSKVYSNNMDAIEFMSQLPTPPEKSATRKAVRELKELQLLDNNENLTSLGRTLSCFQLEPKLAKILVNAVIYKCLTPVVDIVTIFSADTEIFSGALRDKESVKKIKSKGCKDSDHLAMMRLFEAWLELMEENSLAAAEHYCTDVNLVHHKLETLYKLRKVHFDYLYDGLYHILPLADNYSDNDELVKAILYSGVGTLLRHKNSEIVKGRLKRKSVFYTNHNQRASITSDSVNFKKSSFSSDFLVYFNETRSNVRRTTLIRECSSLAPLAVVLFSDKQLIIKQIQDNENQVILAVEDRNLEFICSKEEAHQIKKCKEALNSAYSYFIYQMTEGGECNLEINSVWDRILHHLNSVLLQNSIN